MPTSSPPPPDTPESPPPRWEAEIREILEATDRLPTPSEKARGSLHTARHRTRPKIESRVSSARTRAGGGIWLIALLVFSLLAFGLRHFSPFLGRVVALVALITLFVFLYKAFYRRGGLSGTPSSLPGADETGSNPTIESWKKRMRQDDR